MATSANLTADSASSSGTKKGWISCPNGAGVLAVGDLVEPDLERREDEEEEPDLRVGARGRVTGLVLLVRGGVGHQAILT